MSVDVTFFECVPYFSSPVLGTTSVSVPFPRSVPLLAPSSPDSLPVPLDTSEPNASTTVRALVKDF